MEISVAGERALLEGMLDTQRQEVACLLVGMSLELARARLVPSLTTPLGLVKHATFVEKVWFHSRVAGVPREVLELPVTVEETFVLAPEDTVESVTNGFIAACAHSREAASSRSLDEQFPWHDGPVTLRFVYVHMIAELARHAGHADILIEQLRAGDGPAMMST